MLIDAERSRNAKKYWQYLILAFGNTCCVPGENQKNFASEGYYVIRTSRLENFVSFYYVSPIADIRCR